MAGHGRLKGMGYIYRCRIESRERFSLLRLKTIRQYRYVLERRSMGTWFDEESGWWGGKEYAERKASQALDDIQWTPGTDRKIYYI